MRQIFIILLTMMLSSHAAVAEQAYQTAGDFLAETFTSDVPEPKVLWLTRERKTIVKQLIGHPYHNLRIRYWQKSGRSAWILEETGKEKYITTGIVINHGRIERVKVLIFRESRGWEVRHSFFTNQFKGIQLDNQGRLNQHIDGISGATLSVRALKKVAALALYLATELQDGVK